VRICLFAAAAVTAFVSANALFASKPALAENGPGAAPISVANAEEASQSAGYKVSTPTLTYK